MDLGNAEFLRMKMANNLRSKYAYPTFGTIERMQNLDLMNLQDSDEDLQNEIMTYVIKVLGDRQKKRKAAKKLLDLQMDDEDLQN